MISAGEEEHEGKEDRDDPGASIDLLDLAGEDLDEDVGDEAEGDAVGDVVGQRHEREPQRRDRPSRWSGHSPS